MTNLNNTTRLVKSILETDEQARNSDNLLYLKVIERIAAEERISLEHLTVKRFLASMSILPFPPFESVRRTRQKVQAAYPELASDKRIAELRKDNELVYRAFALGELDA